MIHIVYIYQIMRIPTKSESIYIGKVSSRPSKAACIIGCNRLTRASIGEFTNKRKNVIKKLVRVWYFT